MSRNASSGLEEQNAGSLHVVKKRSWLRRHVSLALFLVAGGMILLASAIVSATPSPALSQGGRGGIEGATADPAGYFCAGIFGLLDHFQIYTDTSGVMPVIGVPPDYSKGSSATKSGILTSSAEQTLVDLFPNYTAQKPQDAYQQNVLGQSPSQLRMCASEANGKQAITSILNQFYGVSPSGAQGPALSPGNNQSSVDLNPAHWIWNGLSGVWNQFWLQTVDFFQHQIIDWASSLGFIYITPAALSYKNPMVLAGANWSLAAMDGFVAILLVISGYQVAMHRYLDMQETTLLGSALKVVLAAVAANVGFIFLLPTIVELSNTMSMGIMGALLQASTGDVSLPLGALNWVGQPATWSVFILVDFFGAIFLVFVEGVRLAVLDVTILFFPWWLMALSNEATRNWGRLGATTFFCSLFMQPIQIAVVSLGSAMIANWGHLNYNDPAVCTQMPQAAKASCLAHLGHASMSTSTTPITLLLGIATIYVACKIPGMMFSSAVRASVGAVNRDVAGVAKAAMGVILLQRQLNR